MAIDFGSGALPYCIFSDTTGMRRLGVGVGTDVIDLAAAAGTVTSVPPELVTADRLNPLLAAGEAAWTALRDELSGLVGSGRLDDARRAQDDVTLHLPWDVADYVDFYSSRHHAENLGRIFRPDSPGLPENWLHLPSGYHGRSSTVVVDGTPIRRPKGQVRSSAGLIGFEPTSHLDFELELGFVVGGRTELGEPVAIEDAAEHLFGVVLMNDWSARDLQAWEYVPLGPFLGKSFATSVSAWVTPMAALESIRTAGPVQEPAPLPHLRTSELWSWSLDLEVWIRPARAERSSLVSRVDAAEGLYWNPAQQLAHLTSNGARLSPGDLFGSGTVSGPTPDQRGSLVELSWDGSDPIAVGDHSRSFLSDGDEVTLRAASRDGRIVLGPVSGTVIPH